MVDYLAIDAMNRPHYANPELAKNLFDVYEYQALAETTFGGILDARDIEKGEEWRVLVERSKSSISAVLEEMDYLGIELAFMDQGLTWSYRDSKAITIASIDDLVELSQQSKGRIVPGAGYNPNRISQSIDRIVWAVTEHDFKYVWFQPTSFGIRPSDETCYPLYQKCSELGIPVCMESGQLAYPSTSEPGHPMYVEEVAMDFPDLTIVLTHSGWPWIEEWCSMLWRFPNVFGNIGGYYPSFLPDTLVEFMDGRIRDKVMWATNALGSERCYREFLELPLNAKTKRKVLRENALNVFDV